MIASLSSPALRRGLMAGLAPPEPYPELARFIWENFARQNQQEPPGDWRYWVVLAGRGFGKTRIGSEWVRQHATSGSFRFVNIIGATTDDARDIMIEGESGILSVCPDAERPRYIKSARKLIWPNGCTSLIFTADEPERLRGKQHEKLWCDEIAAWRYSESWTQAMLGLRLGANPQALATTTPKPRRFLKKLLANPHVVVSKGTTYDNRENLAPAFFEEIITVYEGTHLGRQELDGHFLEEAEGALWRREWIDKNRLEEAPATLDRVVIGVDPPGGVTECGLVAAGIGQPTEEMIRQRIDAAFASATYAPEMAGDLVARIASAPHRYTLGDWSERLSAADWGAKCLRMALHFAADQIVAETNYGGDMVAQTIATAADGAEFAGNERARQLATVAMVPKTATRGKAIRAEPWSALAQQGREHHCGKFDDLEDELCTWEPGQKSPNRLDAKVWALSGLDGSPPAESGNVGGWL